MCGIAGFIDKQNQLNQANKQKIIKQMMQKLEHRGQDDVGFFIKNNIVLGHARLSILDLTKRGHQPFLSADKKIVLTYNGEIYNFLELNKILAKKYSFKTTSDTETLMNGYQEWNLKSLNKFKGMFAFGIYDQLNKTLTLAVDRFGIKPLYYINNNNFFAFASEIKALFCLPGVKAELNTDALGEYLLYRCTAGADTLFQKIKRLCPAQCLQYNVKTDKTKMVVYYQPRKIALPADQEKLTKKFLNILHASTEQHLLADAPLGLQLSGGVDSSLIAALATQIKQKNFHSFSIGLKRPGWNEFKYSRLVAKKLHTIHHELYFTEDDFCRLLPQLTYHLDKPMNHLHSVPMYLLAKYARRYVKVLMSGEGADEIFFGYRRYQKITNAKHISDKLLIQSSQFADKKIMSKIVNVDFEPSIVKRQRLITNLTNPYDKLFKLEMLTYLVPLLIRQDKMGMAANIENRVPFLDHNLVEFAYSLPLKLKLSKNDTKIFLKKIATKFLPRQIVWRPKVGFGLPQNEWLRHKNGLGEYLKFFTTNIQTKRHFINYSELQTIITEHQTKKADHSQLLWILIALEIWLQIFIDRRPYQDIWPGLNQ